MKRISLIIIILFGAMPMLMPQTASKAIVLPQAEVVHTPQTTVFEVRNITDFSDNFETYPNFNLTFAPWTTVDVDQKTTYGIEGVTFPNSGQAMSFIIFNPTATTPPLTDAAIAPHSGSKFAASFAATSGANNDWLISPQITLGSNSSVSFWVKSYTAQYGLERYKVGVSTTNTNPSSFTIISGPNYLTAPATQWEQKTFDLNAYNGQSVYVGIQCVSEDAFIFLVDDFSLTTTATASLPAVTTADATSVTQTTAVSGGNVTSDGGATVTTRGIVWSTSANPTTTTNLGMTNNGSGTGSFVSNMTGLTANTTYFVRAFATNSVGTAYGQQISFTTTGGGSGTGTLAGYVTDAVNGNPIPGALVSIAGLSATTNASGNYSITNIPVGVLTAAFNASVTSGPAPLTVQFFDQSSDGSHTLTCSKTGYMTYTNNGVVVPQGGTLTMDISLSPTLAEGSMRFVLNWGATPPDLDSHLNTPNINGTSYHIYYSYQGSATSGPYAALDHDDTNGYGPETVTIYQKFPGTYQYYIYNYSGSPSITTSSAVVQIYNQNGLTHTLQVPTTGEGRYWYVADVDGATGQVTIKNTIQGNAPGNRKDEMPPKKEQDRSVISWQWNFGDGTTSTEQNPSKTYQNAGSYTVSLTVGNGTTTNTVTKTNYIQVGGGSGTGTLTGMVTDALNGNPIEGALVSIAGLSATTNASGNYTINNIPVGTLTAAFNESISQGTIPLTVQFFDQSGDDTHLLTCSKTGYITYNNSNVAVPQGGSLTMDISLSPTLAEGSMRFVLNWGATPPDLDSHLNTPSINGTSYHVYYSYKGSATSGPYAALDHDDTNGYGPETVTIYQKFPGTYQYYIYNYTGSPSITTSAAVVQIYNQNGLLHTLQVPTSGEGRYWYVGDVDGATGQVTIKNTIQSNAPGNRKDVMPPKENRAVTSWAWDFGDGTSSTEQNPVKVYQNAGVYTVKLTVGNGTTFATKVKEDHIVATTAGSIRDGLVAYFPFNGNADDHSGRDHHGTNFGASLSPDRFGSSNEAMLFNGTSSHIEVQQHNDFDIKNKLTLSCWLRHDANPASCEDILTKGTDAYGLMFACNGSGEIGFNLFTNSESFLSSGVKPLSGYWYHVAAVYDGISQRIYINGVLKNEISRSGVIHTNNNLLMMGWRTADGHSFYNGLLDEVRVYNRAFLPSEVPSLVRDAAGVDEHTAGRLVIYPNPAREVVTVPGFESGTVKIFDLRGRWIMSAELVNGFVNVSQLDKGSYLMQLQTNDQVLTARFVKE